MSAEIGELIKWQNLAKSFEGLYTSLKKDIVNLQGELITEIRLMEDKEYYDNDSEAVGYGRKAEKEEIFDRLNAITKHFPQSSD